MQKKFTSEGLFTRYRNEFHSGLCFVTEWSSVLHSQNKIERLSLKRSRHQLKTIRMRHSPQTTRFAVFISERSSFSVYMITEWNVIPQRDFIRIENQNDLIPEWLVRERNFISVSCKQIQKNTWNELVPEWKPFRYHVNYPWVMDRASEWVNEFAVYFDNPFITPCVFTG